MCSLLSSLPSLAFISILLFSQVNKVQATCPSPLAVHARLPPSIDPKVNSSPPAWPSPPYGWFYGNWKVTYSSNPTYAPLVDFEYISTPVLPSCKGAHPSDCSPGTFPGQNVDLVTFSAPNSSAVSSAFGYDTPRQLNFPQLGRGWNNTYDYVGTGPMSAINNTWELLAWGYDENGDGYLVEYETKVVADGAPADVNLESRSPTGPSNGTHQAIIKALEDLGSKELTKLVGELLKLNRTAGEDSRPPFVCDLACQNNTAS